MGTSVYNSHPMDFCLVVPLTISLAPLMNDCLPKGNNSQPLEKAGNRESGMSCVHTDWLVAFVDSNHSNVLIVTFVHSSIVLKSVTLWISDKFSTFFFFSFSVLMGLRLFSLQLEMSF